MVDGDTFNGYTVQGIGLSKTGQVQYRALSVYLTPSSVFVDYYDVMNISCGDLIGSFDITDTDCEQVDYALLATEMNTSPDCDGGWATAYGTLFENESDLELLRRYRDEILVNIKKGRFFTSLLYKSSEEALAVLNNNPELMSRAADLLNANINAVNKVLSGGVGAVYNTRDVLSFLTDYAAKSPPPLSDLAIIVRDNVRQKHMERKPLLGFYFR
jgi:hypothetical protein